MSNVGVIIQARMSSTRLPGKVLAPLIGGLSIIEFLYLRLSAGLPNATIVVATSDSSEDLEILNKLEQFDAHVFRGSLCNVAERFLKTCDQFGFDHFVRVTADNPFTDFRTIDAAIATHLEGDSSYTSTKLGSGFPMGVDVEVTRTRDLARRVHLMNASEQEHVTLSLYNGRMESLGIDKNLYILPLSRQVDDKTHARLTIDYECDLELARILAELVAENGLPTMAPWESFAEQAILTTARLRSS